MKVQKEVVEVEKEVLEWDVYIVEEGLEIDNLHNVFDLITSSFTYTVSTSVSTIYSSAFKNSF